MRGSDFVQQFASRGAAAWEAAALSEARRGTHVPWALAPVTVSDGVHTLTFRVARDYFAVGTEDDALRMPLTPLTAQKIADVFGMLLPTPKMVKAIHEQARTKLVPTSMVPNRYADLRQYAAHNQAVEAELTRGGGVSPGLVSGTKKDIVLGNQARPNKVLIYGWMQPDVPAGKDVTPMMSAPWRVQPYSSVHGTDYVDYSHGVRFVSPDAELDGRPVKLADVLQDPALAGLVSDEGPLKSLRYNVPKGNLTPVPYIPGAPRLVDQGLAWIQEQVLERKD